MVKSRGPELESVALVEAFLDAAKSHPGGARAAADAVGVHVNTLNRWRRGEFRRLNHDTRESLRSFIDTKQSRTGVEGHGRLSTKVLERAKLGGRRGDAAIAAARQIVEILGHTAAVDALGVEDAIATAWAIAEADGLSQAGRDVIADWERATREEMRGTDQ